MENKINIKDRIGIMGGTFDPIHYGHLAVAEEARIKYKLSKIIFIPSGLPPHKDRKVSDSFHRWNMALIATLDNEDFGVSTMEVERKGPSYTIDTLKEIKNSHPNSQLYFILGADAFYDIETWSRVDEVFKMAIFVGATRPGSTSKKLKDHVEYISKKYNGTINMINVPSLEISSTDIRRRVREGLSIKYLVPWGVCSYIKKYNLYRWLQDELWRYKIESRK